jgi:uncharacterized membrane protein (UPF0127 family)
MRSLEAQWQRFIIRYHMKEFGTTLAKLRIRNQSRDTLVADRADIADTSAKRRQGLLKHTGLEPGEGLWIAPCEAVHTLGMKFPIDVLFLDKKKKVLKVRSAMPRRRMAVSLLAHSVLELPSGRAAETGTVAGDQLEFEKYD